MPEVGRCVSIEAGWFVTRNVLVHLLRIQNLSKRFGNKTLFDQVSFVLGPTDRVGLVGVNGSGKTTLLRMIVGLEPPDAG